MAEKRDPKSLVVNTAASVGLALTVFSASAQEPPQEPVSASAQNTTVTGTPGAFDIAQMRDAFRAAILPIAYERALVAGQSPEAATNIVRSYMPERTDFSILRHQNSTAIVTYNRDKARVTVAFDATDEKADVLDDMKFWGKENPLGGKTHSGIANAQFYRDNLGMPMVERVWNEIATISGGQPVTLAFTGFSRGGGQSTAAAANWLVAQQRNGDGAPPVLQARLTDVYTFGGLAYGDKDFVAAYSTQLDRQGITQWRVIAGDDSAQKNMTTEAWYGKDLYRHVGTTIYMLPLPDGTTEHRVAAPLTVYEQKTLSKTNWHDPNLYADLMGLPDIKMAADGRRLTPQLPGNAGRLKPQPEPGR